ncbi:MAG TPA: SCO family protein [Gammaproteobacteria bacterium]|nr:SCO family protein [Gammaproteobacteria bacterium]
MKRTLLLTSLLGLVTLLLAACGGGTQQWKTTNITGVMPDLKFTLTDENGKTVHADAWRGKVKLMYFGYAHCPDICPLTLATVGRAISQLGDQSDAVRVLFVSVDPKRDPPPVLKEYTQAFGPEFVGLTGTQDQLKALSKRYRVSYSYGEPDANGEYAVNHSSAVFVFDKNGDVRLLMNREDGADAMAHDLRQLVNAS